MTNGYTNIPDWMLALDLDVYETIIFAVIFGFSQDGDSSFTGSQRYLARKAKCSLRKVGNALPHLVELGLVKKDFRDFKGMRICEYRVCTACIGYAQEAGEGHALGATNTIDTYTKVDNNNNKREAFKKPTIEEISAYCRERGNGIDAEAFYAYYEAKGWVIGKSKMKEWKAAVITWEKNNKKGISPARMTKESALEHNLRVADQMFGTDMHSQFYKTPEYDEQ